MRIFRLIATPLVLLGLLGLLIWGALWGWSSLTAPLPSPSPTPCVVESATVIKPAQVSVRVYNGGYTTGLAQKVQTRLVEQGFTVVKVDNTDEQIKAVTLRGSKSQDLQLQLLASQFVEPKIEHDDRVDGTVDVLLTTDAPKYNEKPLAEIASPSGSVCIVASKSPSPSPSPEA